MAGTCARRSRWSRCASPRSDTKERKDHGGLKKAVDSIGRERNNSLMTNNKQRQQKTISDPIWMGVLFPAATVTKFLFSRVEIIIIMDYKRRIKSEYSMYQIH